MWKVRLTDAALTSFKTVAEEDRAAVLSAIGRLTFGPNPPGVPQAYRLRNRPDLVVLRADPHVRIVYTVNGDEITVIDVMNHDRVNEYPDVIHAA